MGKSYFFRVHEQTMTRFWINNVTREQASLAIESGAVGCTQNPAYTWKMMESDEERDYVLSLLDGIMENEKDDNMALVTLQRELVRGIAREFKPMFDASGGRKGFVSIQGDPFREDKDSIIEFARFNRQAGENVMAKIPVVESGLEAIEALVKEHVPINATECMAVRQVLDVCELYEKAARNIVNPAPLYFSVITGIFDEHMRNVAKRDGIDVSTDALYMGGFAIAKKIHEMVRERGYNCGYISGGARGLHHFTEMVGADCCVTINWNGTADKLIELDGPVIPHFHAPVSHSVIDELVYKIPEYKKAYFVNEIEPEEYDEFGPVVLFRMQFEDAWKNASAFITERR